MVRVSWQSWMTMAVGGAIAATLGSCSGGETVANSAPSAGGNLANATIDQGDLQLDYLEPDQSDHDEVFQVLQDSGFYDAQVAELNLTFAFPQDISVVFSSCEEENAWYDPEAVEITLCYNLIKHYADIAHAEYQEDYATEVIHAGFFTFYHELGHALVDQYQLPITGQEEDAVDEFAAILLIQSQDYEAVIAGMEQFDIDAVEEAESGEPLAFWADHSLSDQRFYTIACLIYGSDPNEYESWVADDFLPEERADICEEDYERAQASWDQLLEPHRL